MSLAGRLSDAWCSLRYDWLLPLAGRNRLFRRIYVLVCASIDWNTDRPRRDAATERIRGWLGVDPTRAEAIFWSAVQSEAEEEAEACWFMRREGDLDEHLPSAQGPIDPSPSIWVTLHMASPLVAFLFLRRVCGIDVRVVGRPLDLDNPMPDAKRRWGKRKVEWIERVSGTPFLGIDAQATARARDHVLQGGSLFVMIDVPGDIVDRRATRRLCDEQVSMANGIARLCELLRAPLRPIVATQKRGGHHLHYREAVTPWTQPGEVDSVAAMIESLVVELPGDWWLWPYVPPKAASSVGRRQASSSTGLAVHPPEKPCSVQQILACVLHLPIDSIDPTAALDELAPVDSLVLAELAAGLHEAFSVSIPADRLRANLSVEELEQVVQDQISSSA